MTQKVEKAYRISTRVFTYFGTRQKFSKQDPHVFLTLKLDPASVALEKSFSRDVTHIGHWGTGDLELTLRTPADFEKAKSLIERAYQEN